MKDNCPKVFLELKLYVEKNSAEGEYLQKRIRKTIYFNIENRTLN